MLNVASKQSDLPKIPKCDLFSSRLFLSKEKINILYIRIFLNFYIGLSFSKRDQYSQKWPKSPHLLKFLSEGIML